MNTLPIPMGRWPIFRGKRSGIWKIVEEEWEFWKRFVFGRGLDDVCFCDMGFCGEHSNEVGFDGESYGFVNFLEGF